MSVDEREKVGREHIEKFNITSEVDYFGVIERVKWCSETLWIYGENKR